MTTVDLVRDYPAAGQPIGQAARRFAIRPFAYDLIYLPGREDVLVVANPHHRRRPGYWHERL